MSRIAQFVSWLRQRIFALSYVDSVKGELHVGFTMLLVSFAILLDEEDWAFFVTPAAHTYHHALLLSELWATGFAVIGFMGFLSLLLWCIPGRKLAALLSGMLCLFAGLDILVYGTGTLVSLMFLSNAVSSFWTVFQIEHPSRRAHSNGSS